MPTTTLSSVNTRATGQYKRTLKSNTPDAKTKNPNLYIQPANGPGTNQQVSGMWIYDSLVFPGEGFQSDNSTSGITFIALQQQSYSTSTKTGTANYDSVYFNFGPNSTGTRDFGDSIYVDSGNRQLRTLNNSTIIAGTELPDSLTNPDSISGAKDNDLVFLGSEKSLDGTAPSNSYLINFNATTPDGKTAANFKTYLSNVYAPNTNTGTGVTPTPSSANPLQVNNTQIYTGKDDDTLVFANDNAASRVENSLLDVGTGADLVFFAGPNTIYGGNAIHVGDDSGAADAQVDSIIFNFYTGSGSAFNSTLDGKGSNFIDVQGFGANDKLFYNGVMYTGQTEVNNAAWNANGIIKFS